MSAPDVLVVGGGPAGLAASVAAARAGLSVLLVEQRPRLGGAILRRAFDGRPPRVAVPVRHLRAWERLEAERCRLGERIRLMCETVFLGVDGAGRFLFDDRAAGRVKAIRPRGVVFAVGAVERVLPRPGWELPGVLTAGGMQLGLKETGEIPDGPVLIAGSGPLPLVLAAQLVAAGRSPVAVLERGQPLGTGLRHPLLAARAMASWPHLIEGAAAMARLVRFGVPWHGGWAVRSVRPAAEGLEVHATDAAGRERLYHVRHLVLHDGLRPNVTGLPATKAAGVPVLRAGDCRDVLGADAAVLDGARTGEMLVRRIADPAAPEGPLPTGLGAARRLQDAFAALCAFTAPPIPPETVLCRCEGRDRVTLDALGTDPGARTVRLVGRFGMGLCQGRFCADTISELGGFAPEALAGTAPRWPLRPVSVAALAALDVADSDEPGVGQDAANGQSR